MPVTTLITDTECYPNLWCIGMKRVSDGKVLVLEKSDRCELDTHRLETLIRTCRIVGFNLIGYDMAMTWAAIRGYSLAELKALNDKIITERVPWWQLDRVLGWRVPQTDIIDLIEPQPNAVASLKTLNGRLHGRRMQDLPYPPDHVLSDAEREEVISYMGNDLDATHLLFDALAEPLTMREELGADLKIDLRSKSDTQVGFSILKSRVEHMTGERLGKAPDLAGTTFRYEAPPYIKFHTPQLQKILAQILDCEFKVKANGKVELPKFLSDEKIEIGDSVYQMGLGGLHSTEAHRSVWSTDTDVLIDADVASFYPAIILTLGLYPPAMGPETLPAYSGIKVDRLAAKRAKQKARDKGLKISLNGFFGLTSNPYSPAYAPRMTIAITLTGQLSLLMLIERAHLAGIPAISGNTDGVTFLCPRDKFSAIVNDRLAAKRPGVEGVDFKMISRDSLKSITDRWEKDTGFDLEFVEYRSIHNASVNTYFALKADGSVKRKGLYANPWAPGGDLREQLMKNPNMTICSDAALAFIQHGTPVEETIRACADIRQFVTVVNVRGGGTWRGEYLGKVVRFYWAEGGAPILYKTPHPTTGKFKQVSNTAGSRPLMELPEKFPVDLDYGRYIADALDIIKDVGAAPPEPRKLTRAELLWAVVA